MKVVVAAAAGEQIELLPKSIRARIYTVAERLTKWPSVSGVKPLRGALAGSYRIRTGDYRVQFHLERRTVVIDKVGHRDRFYED